jgi:hypothetical protein
MKSTFFLFGIINDMHVFIRIYVRLYNTHVPYIKKLDFLKSITRTNSENCF